MMKVKCERACFLVGVGRVDADVILALEDGYFKVPTIQANFTVLKNPAKKDAPVITEDLLKARAREAYLKLDPDKLYNALADAGVYIPGDATPDELAGLAYENFGLEIPKELQPIAR